MPELPEVEMFKRYFESTSLNKTIKDVMVKSSQILDNIRAEDLRKKLRSKEFLCCQRYGKYLFINVSEEFWLVWHFGMTGDLKYFKDQQDDPRHDRLLIDFENGYHLAFDCQRKFGRIAVTSKVKDFVKRKRLGKDALELDLQRFKELSRKRQGRTKYTLMNQHIIAGLGNLYSDEILFQSGIHPQAKISELKDSILEELFYTLKKVLNTAISKEVDWSRYPQSYLMRTRIKGSSCSICGGVIQSLKFSGRTTYFCSQHQKLSG